MLGSFSYVSSSLGSQFRKKVTVRTQSPKSYPILTSPWDEVPEDLIYCSTPSSVPILAQNIASVCGINDLLVAFTLKGKSETYRNTGEGHLCLYF